MKKFTKNVFLNFNLNKYNYIKLLEKIDIGLNLEILHLLQKVKLFQINYLNLLIIIFQLFLQNHKISKNYLKITKFYF